MSLLAPGPLSLLLGVLIASPASLGVSAHPWPRLLQGERSEIIRKWMRTERKGGVFTHLNACCWSGNRHLSWIKWTAAFQLSFLPPRLNDLSLCSLVFNYLLCVKKLPQYFWSFQALTAIEITLCCNLHQVCANHKEPAVIPHTFIQWTIKKHIKQLLHVFTSSEEIILWKVLYKLLIYWEQFSFESWSSYGTKGHTSCAYFLFTSCVSPASLIPQHPYQSSPGQDDGITTRLSRYLSVKPVK